MANPYSVGSPIPDMSPTILTLGKMALDRRAQLDDLAMREQALNETARQHNIANYGTATPQPGAQTIQSQQLGLEQKKFETQNPRQKKWTRSGYDTFKAGLIMGGMPKDLMELSIFKDLEQSSENPQVPDVGTLADSFSEMWANGKQQYTSREIGNKIQSMATKVGNMDQNDPKRAEMIQEIEKLSTFQQFVDQLDSPDKAKQAFFGDVYQYDQNKKAELVKQRAEMGKNRYIQTDQGLFDTATQSLIPNTGKLVTGKARDNFMAAGNDIVDISGDKPKLVHRAPFKPEKEKPEMTATEKRSLSKDISEAETLILSNSGKQEVAGKVNFFNQYSPSPYAYQWKQGKLYGGTWGKLKLPVINKKQVTAKDVYDTAEKHGMTYDDVLRQIGALK